MACRSSSREFVEECEGLVELLEYAVMMTLIDSNRVWPVGHYTSRNRDHN